MNCPRCNTPLAPDARFCPNCGTAVAPNESNPSPSSPVYDASTQPTTSWQQQPQSAQNIYYQPTAPVQPGTMRSAGDPAAPQVIPPRRRRRRMGCLIRGLITLLVLLILFGGGWFFILRPYLHTLVQDQVDQVLTTAVNQVPPLPPVVPINNKTIAITETEMNNFFVLNSAPSNPVQGEQMHIMSSGLRLDFKAYGFPCTITGVPRVVNGQLVADNVTVQGIVLLVMSPDEITALLDRHLADAQQRLNHPISAVQLKEHELDVILG